MKNTLTESLAIIALLCGLCALSRPTSAQTTNTITTSNTPPVIAAPTGLPAPVQSVLDFVPTIDTGSTTLSNTTIELRIGTTTAASAKDSGAFSDVQCSYE